MIDCRFLLASEARRVLSENPGAAAAVLTLLSSMGIPTSLGLEKIKEPASAATKMKLQRLGTYSKGLKAQGLKAEGFNAEGLQAPGQTH